MEGPRQLCPHLLLLKSGQLRVDPGIVENLKESLIQASGSQTFSEATTKVRLRLSKVRIHTQSAFYAEVFSAPKSIVKHWALSLGLTSIPGLCSNRDLDKGKYEGGFKVWESTRDLISFVTENQDFMGPILRGRKTFKALELGAGCALPSLALLSRMIEDPQVTTNFRIHLQDFNWQVLASLTLINFAINLHPDYFDALIRQKCLRLYSGDWKTFRQNSNYKYDLIMMSEVIYNSDNYEALHSILERHLDASGFVIIATKDTYFGLTGSLYAWLEYIETRGVFQATFKAQTHTANIPRSILIMKRL